MMLFNIPTCCAQFRGPLILEDQVPLLWTLYIESKPQHTQGFQQQKTTLYMLKVLIWYDRWCIFHKKVKYWKVSSQKLIEE